jgi:hypothetical protein
MNKIYDKMVDNNKNNKNENGGFIALITAVLLSATVMAVALSGSNEIGAIFDQANRKAYRLAATENALFCLDQAFVELAHDYFYSVGNVNVPYPNKQCSILSVTAIASSTMPTLPKGALKSITVTGTAADPRYHIIATITAQVLLGDGKISLLSETTDF